MLHDDSLSDDLTCMIMDIGLMQWVGDVTTSGGEIGKVRHHHKVEIVVEVAGVIAARHCEKLRYCAHAVESVTKCLLCLRRHSFGPLINDHLPEHRLTP